MSVMNEDNIELSIIIPVYNNEKLVIKCLDSIKNQKIQNYECIIIDDGSTDGSLGICEEYAKNNNNFRVIRKKNGGVSSARNIGIQNSKGKYVTFVDSDDYLLPGCYSAVLRAICENNSDIVCFGMLREKSGKLIEEKFNQSTICKQFINYRAYMHAVVNKVFLRTLILENNITFDEDIKICEDMLFAFSTMIHARKIQYIPENYYVYYDNENSASNSSVSVNKIRDFEKSAIRLKDICKKENVSNQYSKLINYRLDEAALQYLINSDCYYPNEYRRIGRRFKVWSHSFKPALMIVTFFSSINIDFFSKIYANIRKNKISLFKKR